ncbi:MAG: hypothetical protein IKC79_02100 [Clostridia bacterium]|nr:hypothetical protein [Clostridia bacterium]
MIDNQKDNKIYELMTSKVRELNHNIDTNLNTYITEVANSRAIRSNILDNIRKDAISVNEFISGFNLTEIQPHYIAEALAKNPNQNILDIMTARYDNMLDDDKVVNVPYHTVRFVEEYTATPAQDMYYDDVNYQGEESEKIATPTQGLPGKQTTLSDYLGEVDISPMLDDVDAIFDTPDTPPAPAKDKRPRRTYTLVIDNEIQDNKDARYIIQTTLYVSPKGEIAEQNNTDMRIR